MSKDKTIIGYAATFRRDFDSQGEIISSDAFTEFVLDFKRSKKALPLLFGHNRGQIDHFIGTVYDLEIDNKGLKFYGYFDDTEEALKARKLALDGRITNVSIGYEVLKKRDIVIKGRRGTELQKIRVKEISLVLMAADNQSIVTDIKTLFDDSVESVTRQAIRRMKRRERLLLLAEAELLLH